MNTSLSLALAAALLGAAALALVGRPAPAAPPAAASPPRTRAFSKTLPLPGAKPPLSVVARDAALREGDPARAEAIVDAALARIERESRERPGRRDRTNELHLLRATILARLGKDEAALAEYAALVRGAYGDGPLTHSRDLAPGVELAVRLGRPEKTDAIATMIANEPGWEISSMESLNFERPGATPDARLAHAYLTLASNASEDMKREAQLDLCKKAFALRPNEVPVLIQLAVAYAYHHGEGDRAKHDALFRAAYAALPKGSVGRRDLRIFASGEGVEFPDEGTSFEQDLRAHLGDELAKRAAEAAARGKAKGRP